LRVRLVARAYTLAKSGHAEDWGLTNPWDICRDLVCGGLGSPVVLRSNSLSPTFSSNGLWVDPAQDVLHQSMADKPKAPELL
jgi:hypothetical protein